MGLYPELKQKVPEKNEYQLFGMLFSKRSMSLFFEHHDPKTGITYYTRGDLSREYSIQVESLDYTSTVPLNPEQIKETDFKHGVHYAGWLPAFIMIKLFAQFAKHLGVAWEDVDTGSDHYEIHINEARHRFSCDWKHFSHHELESLTACFEGKLRVQYLLNAAGNLSGFKVNFG